MSKKINFSIENIEEIPEDTDSSFSLMKVDFFASGDNAHNLIISDETLLKTAKTIYNVPVVWKYDGKMNDAMSHEDDEYPCGFVKEGSLIEEKRLSDNRLMLSTVVYIWKKYSGKLIDIFKRDKKKSVSVEMTVLEANDNSGMVEVTDYKFEAITILGNFVRPAISGAEMSVLSFSREYEDAYKKEFGNKYSELDFRIPSDVKDNAKIAIEKYEKLGKGGSSVSLSLAKFLIKEEFTNPSKIRLMYKKLSSYSKKSLETDEDQIRFELWGGSSGYMWAKELFEKLESIDNKRSAFFVGDNEDVDFPEKDGKEEMSVKKEKLFEEKEDEKTETPEEEKSETPEEQKKEEEDKTEMAFPDKEEPQQEEMAVEPEEPKEAEMSLDSYLDMAYMLSLMEEETESRKEFLKETDEFALKCAVDEIKKDGDKDFSVVSKGMFAKMKEMSAKMAKMEEENKAYMAEFESLKSFKKSSDEARFSYEVESTLTEVGAVMPADEIEKARAESVDFSVETIDAWKNAVKAKAFTFSKPESKETKKQIAPRWAFNVDTNQTKETLWKKQ